MQTTSIAGLLPVLIFLVFALGLAIAARRRSRAAGEGGFVKEYFIGNRTLGGFVLAMTTIATYGSVSSFVGGPGQAWQIRLWLGVYGGRAGNDAVFALRHYGQEDGACFA